MDFLIEFDIMAFIISSVTLLMYSAQKQISTRQNVLFMFMLICSVISSLAGFLSSIIINSLSGSSVSAAVLTTVFYLNHNSIPICVFSYVLTLSGRYPKKLITRSLLCIPYFFSAALILTNPFTRFVFYISPSGEYCKSWGVLVLYMTAFIYLLAIVFLFIFQKVKLSQAVKNSIFICFIIPIIAIVIQMNMSYILLESFAGALCFLYIFMSIQNIKHNTDPVTHFYTTDVFNFLIQERIDKENDFYVILMRSPDIPVLQELFDYKHYSSLLLLFSHRVSEICNNNFEIFCIEEGLFAFIPKKSMAKSSIGSTALELVNTLERVWTFETIKVEITIQVSILHYPPDFQTMQDISERIELLSRFPRKIGNRHIFYGKDIQPGDIKYRAHIITQLNEVFRANYCNIRYQGVYDTELNQYTALEVSVFMTTGDNKRIRQHDVFDAAHNTGKSKKLNSLIFRQSFWWFVKERLTSFGIRKLQVKLQESQCISNNWGREILDLCSECSFEPEHLCLEISESILRFNETAFYTNINILKDAGVNFAIDGFGTGYSDMERIIRSPVDSIKLDKELIHESIGTVKGKRLLKGTFAMFTQMAYKVVAEGVETRDQYEYLLQCGCTLFQGYHISKPLSGSEIILLLKTSRS